jgi:hypothetical protein
MAIIATVSLPGGSPIDAEQAQTNGGVPVQLTLQNNGTLAVQVLSVQPLVFVGGTQQGADMAGMLGGMPFSSANPQLAACATHGAWGTGPGQNVTVPAAVGNQPGVLVMNSACMFRSPKGLPIGAFEAGSNAFSAAMSGAPLGSGAAIESPQQFDIGAVVYCTDPLSPVVDAGKASLTIDGIGVA